MREFAMAFVTTGLPNGGVTAHYRFSYDDALGGPGGLEPARTNAVIANCESDYALMSGWFGGGLTVTGMSVQVTTQSHGASWSGTSTNSTIQLNAQGSSYSGNAAYLRYLLIAEVTEIFMMTQGRGWFQGADEGSKGEGLSRFLSGQFLAINGFLGLGIIADYAVADLWLNSPRQDFVNTAPDDHGYNGINGCTTLFIYYLFHQLGYGINQIVAAAGATLTDVYRNLTGDPHDPFPLFKTLLDARFPSQTGSAVPGPNFDDPWPLGDVAWSGVWRSGSGSYYLWIHASQAEFLAKWQELASQNMRLTDIDVATVNGRQLWSGIWAAGTDGYYIWYDADQPHFLAKFSELAAQGLRLVSIKNYDGKYAGAFRAGTDGYYLWVDADDAHFLSKATELAGQNLRLVDFDVATVNGQRRWCGVWRSGTDGWYVWINADWPHFLAKWNELSGQGFRLTGLRYYGGLWAGIWRSGTDAYYLWANANESSFLAKWGGLATQNLRLIDVIATPFGGATGTSTAEAATAVRSGASEVTSGAASGTGPSADAGGEEAMATKGGEGTGAGGGSLPSGVQVDQDRPAAGGSAGVGTGGQPSGSERVDLDQGSPAGSGAGGGSLPTAEGGSMAGGEAGPGQGGGSVDAPAVAAGDVGGQGLVEAEGQGVHFGRRSED
jgi:hypothetical protein